MMRGDPSYAPQMADTCDAKTGEIVDGAWRQEELAFGSALRRRIHDSERDRHLNALDVRNEFMSYFNEEGQVPWQLQSIGMADWNAE